MTKALRIGLLLWFAVLWMSAPAAGAELALCSGTPANSADGSAHYGPDGSRAWLAIFDVQSPRANCSWLSLPVASKDVLALLPISAKQAGAAVALQGTEIDGRFMASEAIISDANTPAALLPLREHALPQLTWQTFGREERARLEQDQRLLCLPGQTIAGAALQSARGWPGGLALDFRISIRGEGQFAFAVSDARRLQAESPLPLGALELTPQSQLISLPVPYNSDRWVSITIVCPDSAAWLQLESVEMHPHPDPHATQRAAWVWSPAAWLEHPDSVWALQSSHRLDTVFITVPVSGGKVRDAEVLAAFVRSARERNLNVWAVIGDPHDVLAEHRAALLGRLAAYADYNRNVAAEARLAGAQLDIEPYLLPGYALAPRLWRQRYLDTVHAARASFDPALMLDLVVPAWWGSAPDWGQQLFDALTAPGISLTVMNYRTDPRLLLEGAAPFLEWASRNQRSVRIALEAGPLPNETQQHYREAPDAGELWLLQVGDQSVLMLLSSAAQGLPGRAYRYSHATPVAAANYTFSGNLQRLEETAGNLLPLWSAWPGFAGVALHGIDAAP